MLAQSKKVDFFKNGNLQLFQVSTFFPGQSLMQKIQYGWRCAGYRGHGADQGSGQNQDKSGHEKLLGGFNYVSNGLKPPIRNESRQDLHQYAAFDAVAFRRRPRQLNLKLDPKSLWLTGAAWFPMMVADGGWCCFSGLNRILSNFEVWSLESRTSSMQATADIFKQHDIWEISEIETS